MFILISAILLLHTQSNNTTWNRKKEQKFLQERRKKNFNTRYAIAWRLHFVNFNSPFYLSLNLYFSVSLYDVCVAVSYMLQGFYGLQLELSHFFWWVFLLLERKCARYIDPSYVLRHYRNFDFKRNELLMSFYNRTVHKIVCLKKKLIFHQQLVHKIDSLFYS